MLGPVLPVGTRALGKRVSRRQMGWHGLSRLAAAMPKLFPIGRLHTQRGQGGLKRLSCQDYLLFGNLFSKQQEGELFTKKQQRDDNRLRSLRVNPT